MFCIFPRRFSWFFQIFVSSLPFIPCLPYSFSQLTRNFHFPGSLPVVLTRAWLCFVPFVFLFLLPLIVALLFLFYPVLFSVNAELVRSSLRMLFFSYDIAQRRVPKPILSRTISFNARVTQLAKDFVMLSVS